MFTTREFQPYETLFDAITTLDGSTQGFQNSDVCMDYF